MEELIEGLGVVSGEVNVYQVYAVSGYIQGAGSTLTSIVSKDAIVISGEVYGAGLSCNKLNFSRTRAIYPTLRREETYSANEAPIASIEYIDFSPNKVLNIISKEDSLYENTAEFFLTETVYNNGTYFPIKRYPYTSDSAGKIDYLVTDYRAQGQNGKALFFQYELLFNAYTVEDGETITLYKNNEVKIDKSQYIVQSSYTLLGGTTQRYQSSDWGPLNSTQSEHRLRILVPIDFSSKDDFYTIDYNKSVYGARLQQKELVELRPIYSKGSHYTITENGITLVGVAIPANTKSLYIVKDPEGRIKPIDIDPPSYQPDQISSWRLRLNPGSVITQSGLFNNQAEQFYLLENNYLNSDNYYTITNVKPISMSENVVRFNQYPIYIDEASYIYPNYNVEIYNKQDSTFNDGVGKVSIEVNGKTRTDIKILSVDRVKGYFQLSQVLDQTDEIEFTFTVDKVYYLILDNLELNPKIMSGGSLYHIYNYKKGLGVALKQYSSADSDTHYPYIYDVSDVGSGRIYYQVPPDGTTAAVSYPASSGNFWPICEISINRLSMDMIKVTDARRIGGGVSNDSMLISWFTNNSGVSIREKDSYLGSAYYGGEPQSFGNTIVVHVPSGVLFAARDKWIDSLANVVDDSIEQVERGTKEFNYYLDQVIKRYISAGTDYILIPLDSNGNFMKIENLKHDSSV